MKIARFVLTAFICTNAFAASRTFVSAASGDDVNPCSRPLPCRSFAAALAQTDADGEIVVIDSGGYGAVTIGQSVAIVSPPGIYAAITATSGNAITVAAGDTGRVVLKNLSLSSQGAANGIDADTVATLSIEGCTISGFTSNGILFDPTTANSILGVTRTIVRRVPNTGINITGGTQQTGSNGEVATLDSVHLYECATGVYATYAKATIQNSVAAGGSSDGFLAFLGSEVTVSESVATNNGEGFGAAGGFMMMTRCEATSNSTGVGSHIFGVIDVSDSTIALNATGVFAEVFSVASSRSNNTLQANTSDGAFNQTFSAH